MYKINFLEGVLKGKSFLIRIGTTTIGRDPGNSIVIASEKISKFHCSIHYIKDQENPVFIEDAGSSNGVFLNDALVNQHVLQHQDKIKIGAEVFQLQALGDPSLFKNSDLLLQTPWNKSLFEKKDDYTVLRHQPPAYLQPDGTFVNKLLLLFEQKVMVHFYKMMFQTEWSNLGLIFFIVFLLLIMLFGISPLKDYYDNLLSMEVQKRASVLAKQLATENVSFIINKNYSKINVNAIDNNDNVRFAAIVDWNGVILAPAFRFNQYLESYPETKFFNDAKEKAKKDAFFGFESTINDVVTAVEPIFVYDFNTKKNIVIAFSFISLDFNVVDISSATQIFLYFEVFILLAIMGSFFLWILYRLTCIPFETLTKDLDLFLKGEVHEITKNFKVKELLPLQNFLEALLVRISASKEQENSNNEKNFSEFISNKLKNLSLFTSVGVMFFGAKREILFLNPIFEELSGIRSDNAIGSTISDVARDQSLGSFIEDLMHQSEASDDMPVQEGYEFSGNMYLLQVMCFAYSADQKLFILTVSKNNESSDD